MDLFAVDFIAKITSINTLGVVVVTFTDNIIIPANYTNKTYFDEDILKLTIIPGESSDSSNLGFYWNCTKFTNREMTLQLVFESPGNVSLNVIYNYNNFRAKILFRFNLYKMDSFYSKALKNLLNTHSK